MNAKAKGNREERKQAEQLSMWMFGDPDVLKRHSSSGADKSVYCGDIIPLKQIEWDHFPFIIEVKSGYEHFVPNFYNYEKVENWYKKARIEGSKHNQYIVLLICQFNHRPALLITNHITYEVNFKVAFPTFLGKVEYAYVYLLKQILSQPFDKIFPVLNFTTRSK